MIAEEEPKKPLVVEEEEKEFPEAEELPEEEESFEAEEPASLEPTTPVEPKDFDWIDDGLSGAETFSDIEKASGKWKCLIHALSTETAPERFMFSEADIQHHGNIVTIYMDNILRYELTGDDFNKLETDPGAMVQFEGNWDEGSGSLEANSKSSALKVVIDKFGDTGSKQYGIGDSFNGDKPLGEIYLVRP